MDNRALCLLRKKLKILKEMFSTRQILWLICSTFILVLQLSRRHVYVIGWVSNLSCSLFGEHLWYNPKCPMFNTKCGLMSDYWLVPLDKVAEWRHLIWSVIENPANPLGMGSTLSLGVGKIIMWPAHLSEPNPTGQIYTTPPHPPKKKKKNPHLQRMPLSMFFSQLRKSN